MARRHMVWNIANAAVLFALGVVLMFAGIGVLRRKRSGISAARTWAVLRILWTIPAAFMTYRVMIDTVKAMEEAGATSNQPLPPAIAGIMQSLGIIGPVVGAIFASALPAFVLIWFSRSSVKAESSRWA